MKIAQEKLLSLLQIADSTWPTGGFAFSGGLEAMAKFGAIRDINSFSSYLESYLLQLSEGDLAFINSVYALKEDDYELALDEIIADWHAFNQVEVIRKGNIISGENWFNLMARVYSHSGTIKLREYFDKTNRPLYFTIVFPLLLKKVGFDLETIQHLFYHIMLRDQMNAAIRLGLLGPEVAQKLHLKFINYCEHLRRTHKERKYYEAFKSQPTLELAQGSHQYLYSRIFQN